jgi:hypothetical protein
LHVNHCTAYVVGVERIMKSHQIRRVTSALYSVLVMNGIIVAASTLPSQVLVFEFLTLRNT